MYDRRNVSRTNIHYTHKLELVNVNQTEPLCFLVPYKHPTRVVVYLLQIIIILYTIDVLPVNIGYNRIGNPVACLRCSGCFVCIYADVGTIRCLDHFDQFVPVSVVCVVFFFHFFAFLFLVIHGFCACMGNISDVCKRDIFY